MFEAAQSLKKGGSGRPAIISSGVKELEEQEIGPNCKLIKLATDDIWCDIHQCVHLVDSQIANTCEDLNNPKFEKADRKNPCKDTDLPEDEWCNTCKLQITNTKCKYDRCKDGEPDVIFLCHEYPECRDVETKCNCIEELDITVEYIKDPTRYNPKIDAYVLDVLEMLKERINCI